MYVAPKYRVHKALKVDSKVEEGWNGMYCPKLVSDICILTYFRQRKQIETYVID